MKKTLGIILLTIIILVFSACKSEENIEASNTNSYEGDTQAPITQIPNSQSPIKHENPRINYEKEEVIDIINKYSDSKFKISEDLYIDAPKSIDHVSTFFNGTSKPLPPKEAIDEVRSVFDFLFPGHYFDESCFYYGGSDSGGSKGGYKRVSERYDAIVNGEVELYLLYYDESETDKEERVALTMQSPFGNTITTINKGVAHKIAYQNGTATDYGYGSDIFMAGQHFTYVDSFPPDSEETFKLLDKEVPIKEAVDFFEDYVKSLPCTVEQLFSVKVIDVQVYKAKEDIYCYNFTTTKMYDGIPFDYAISGSHGGRGNRYIGIGEMIKSDDVDFIYGTFKADTVMEEEQISGIVPLEEAVEISAEKMTNYVDFEVISVQLIYCMDNDLGTGKLGETRHPVFPAWKLTLYNPNDDRRYSCYVNALNGDFEGYGES